LLVAAEFELDEADISGKNQIDSRRGHFDRSAISGSGLFQTGMGQGQAGDQHQSQYGKGFAHCFNHCVILTGYCPESIGNGAIIATAAMQTNTDSPLAMRQIVAA
jgi:hypothetical protein